jgi:hypothetical protein
MWQQMERETKADATSALTEAKRHERLIDELGFRLARTTLACQALWELVRERAGITEEELLMKMDEIDLRDGVKDGKMTATTIVCRCCARKVNTKSSRCMYCGAELVKPHVFQT